MEEEPPNEPSRLPTVKPTESSTKTPILQWRKLSGDTTSNGVPWTSIKNNNKETRFHRGKKNLKVSRQDSINEHARLKRKEIEIASKKKAIRQDRRNGNKNMHIVQSKKSQYTHLTSSQHKAKDEDAKPITYKSSEGEDRREVAALWLQPFSVVDDY